MSSVSHNDDITKVNYEGHFLRFVERKSWEFFQRKNCSGIVVIVSMNNDGKVIFTEQHREPVNNRVVEFPAGLVDDFPGQDKETFEDAAKRELLEETGYKAEKMIKIMEGPAGSGSSSVVLTFYLAKELTKVGDGGGVDEDEDITVHEISLKETEEWLKSKQDQGLFVDPKIYAGLYFLNKYNT